MDFRKTEIRSLIDHEHGRDFSRNINLKGYVFHLQKSFIAFHFETVDGVTIAVIDYIFLTNKKSLVKLLGFTVDFWLGNKVRFIYYKEHERKANYVEVYFKALGFETVRENKDGVWKYPDWISVNGFPENNIVEHFI